MIIMKDTKKLPKNHAVGMKFIDLRLINIKFQCNELFSGQSSQDKITSSCGVQVGYNYVKADNKLVVTLVVAQNNDSEAMPYNFELTAVAFFEFFEETPEEAIDQIAKINCAAIMFPYTRETIADLTRRAGFPPLHLPPMNFVALYNQNQKETAKG